jgi:hypothetical protein
MLTPDILKSLAPTGTLRAGVYTGNFLLITGKTPEGDPDGVSPDLCRAIAQKLGVPLQLIPFKSQDALVDAVGSNNCDIGFVGADPDRQASVQGAWRDLGIVQGGAVPTLPGDAFLAVELQQQVELFLVQAVVIAQVVAEQGEVAQRAQPRQTPSMWEKAGKAALGAAAASALWSSGSYLGKPMPERILPPSLPWRR